MIHDNRHNIAYRPTGQRYTIRLVLLAVSMVLAFMALAGNVAPIDCDTDTCAYALHE